MQCPQCHYLRSSRDSTPADTCPRCGVIYGRFDPEVKRQRDELRRIGEARIRRLALAESARINSAEAMHAWSEKYAWLGKALNTLVAAGLSLAIGFFIVIVVLALIGVLASPSTHVVNIFSR